MIVSIKVEHESKNKNRLEELVDEEEVEEEKKIEEEKSEKKRKKREEDIHLAN